MAGSASLRSESIDLEFRQDTASANESQNILSANSHSQKRGVVSDRDALNSFAPDATIVLVGIRGCGKRSLGFIAATALGRRFITEDHFFQATTGLSRQDYLKLHGSEEFHKHDVEISRRMLEENRTGCVIDCGLGSLTSALQEFLKTYCLTNPVIHILRDMDQIKKLLKLNDRSVRLLENGDSTHRRCSNYEYYNLEDNSANPAGDFEGLDRGSPIYSFKLRQAQADFSRFVQLLSGHFGKQEDQKAAFSPERPVLSQAYTHAIQIPFSAYEDGMINLSRLESGGDVVEVLVDRWKSSALKSLSRMVAEIRRDLKVPVLLTVNLTMTNLSAEQCLVVSKHGTRLAVDFLAIESGSIATPSLGLLAGKGPTQLITTTFLNQSTNGVKLSWTNGQAKSAVQEAQRQGADVVRLLCRPSSRDDNDSVNHFVQSISEDLEKAPLLIAYNTTDLGRTSQIFNKHLTSVTHSTLRELPPPYNSDTATITARESMQALFSSFVLDPLKFCIIGGNVSGSLSPVMHNAAYDLLGLNHMYTTKNIKSWKDVEDLAKDSNLGGASIVQPWKVRLVNKVAHLSEHAQSIGAINTLIPLRALPDGSIPDLAIQAAHRNRAGKIVGWYGDNTDWIAMSSCISRSLSPRNVIQSKSTALVVGAGGMARAAIYAITKLGCKNVFIYNRTVQNAKLLADHYNNWLSDEGRLDGTQPTTVQVLHSLEDAWPSEYNSPTMVVSCVTHEHLDGNPDANFTMPPAWLGSETGGVVLELAYMTAETPLTKQIQHHRNVTGTPWVVVDGIESLFEQALAQFEIMTGRKAPPRCMREALNKAIQQRQTFVADGEEFEVV